MLRISQLQTTTELFLQTKSIKNIWITLKIRYAR